MIRFFYLPFQYLLIKKKLFDDKIGWLGLSLLIDMAVITMAHKKMKTAPASFLSRRKCGTENVIETLDLNSITLIYLKH